MSELTRFVVLSNPAAGMEDEFNEWYEHVHIADVLQVPGLVSAQRFKLHQIALPDSGEDVGPGPQQAQHRYMLIYELDGDPATVMAEMAARTVSGEMPLHESLDLSSITMGFWDSLGPARRS
jgi:hypothetical protein